MSSLEKRIATLEKACPSLDEQIEKLLRELSELTGETVEEIVQRLKKEIFAKDVKNEKI